MLRKTGESLESIHITFEGISKELKYKETKEQLSTCHNFFRYVWLLYVTGLFYYLWHYDSGSPLDPHEFLLTNPPHQVAVWGFISETQRWTHLEKENVRTLAKIDSDELRIVSMNVWKRAFPPISVEMRYKAVMEALQESRAHVICLQEVTIEMLKFMQEESWVRKSYYLSTIQDTFHSFFRTSGLIILSVAPLTSLSIQRLPNSKLALYGKVEFEDRIVTIFNTELETHSFADYVRKDQLKLLSKMMEKMKDVILAGDMGFAVPSEIQADLLLQEFQPVVNTDSENSLTWNPGVNKMLAETLEQETIGDEKARKAGTRDIIYFRSKTLQVGQVSLIGTTPITNTNIYPSVHFGLLTTFKATGLKKNN